jgi:hypothetical protein
MARSIKQKRIIKQPERYKYPTRYGSHQSMVDMEKTGELNKENKVVIEDEHGYYITDENRLDSGLADPNRYKTSRLIWYEKETFDA